MEKVCDQPNLRSQPQDFQPPPIYLDERVYRYLAERARARGVPLADLVNDLLKKSIELSWRLA